MSIQDINSGSPIRDTLTPGLSLADQTDATNFSLTLLPRTVVVSTGTTGTVVVLDTIRYAPHLAHAGSYSYSDIAISVPIVAPFGAANYASLAPDVATVDSSGNLTPLTAGTATILASMPGHTPRRISSVVNDLNGLQVSSFVRFADGSLGKHLADGIAAKISGLASPIVAATKPTTWQSAINIFQSDGLTRNSGGWWGSVDLTAIPTHIGEGSVNGVLVTPRDLLVAAHYAGAVGYTSIFVGGDGTRYTRTVAAIRAVSGGVGLGYDIAVVTLGSDLPAAIKPAKLIPANVRVHAPTSHLEGCGYPCVSTNQDRTLMLFDLTALSAAIGCTLLPSADLGRNQWYYPVRGNDSGSPIFMLVNGELCLLSRFTFSASGACDPDNISQINAAITTNGSPYAVATADLSSFSSY